jgi:hypothetical protein
MGITLGVMGHAVATVVLPSSPATDEDDNDVPSSDLESDPEE